ncbi:MAG: carbohydrate ABC transporter permease, partial [Spirochaetota bacterium]|nr:carbohydrate ABC transporter permease [Spirochaetota bacterium]
SKASLSALFIISFLINWNAFLRPLIYLNSKHLYTLTLGLISFVGEFSALWNFLLAGAVVSVVPIFTVYLIMQKQFIEGITSTGVKG